MNLGLGLSLGSTSSRPVYPKQDNGGPELLLQSAVSIAVQGVSEGTIVRHLAIPFLEIKQEIDRDSRFLFEFAKYPDRFEEFLASCYDKAGFDEVILTPRSGDKGRDVIATMRGQLSIRILDQAKAFSQGHKVGHNDIRAMLHVISNDRSASKGYVTTTSEFASGIIKPDSDYAEYMPTRLQLRDGAALSKWIEELGKS